MKFKAEYINCINKIRQNLISTIDNSTSGFTDISAFLRHVENVAKLLKNKNSMEDLINQQLK